MKVLALLPVLMLVFAPWPASAAKLYKWVDKDGNVSYQDRPPPAGATAVEEKALRTRAGEDQAAEKVAVVLYVTPKCSSCDLARAYLQKRKVPFTEKNVESERALQDELKTKSGGLAVPTILVGDKVMRGYLESLLEGELDQAGYPKAQADTDAEAKPPSDTP